MPFFDAGFTNDTDFANFPFVGSESACEALCRYDEDCALWQYFSPDFVGGGYEGQMNYRYEHGILKQKRQGTACRCALSCAHRLVH